MKIYLAGAINGCTDEEANGWRSEAKSLLNKRFKISGPMDRSFRGDEHNHIREIVEGDKVEILTSGLVLINAPKPSWGTAMEVLYAWEHSKPTVVISDFEMKISPWIIYHATEICPSIENACQFINKHY